MRERGFFIDKELPPVLEKKELEKLFIRFKNGDNSARETIIHHNIRLVINVVEKKIVYFTGDKKDIVSTGLIGLIKAVDSYDYLKNTNFSTYAYTCIINEINVYLNQQKRHYNQLSLEKNIITDKDGSEYKLEKILPSFQNIEEGYVKKELYEKIVEIIYSLKEPDKDIMIMYFGIEDGIKHSQEEIGKKYGTTRANISLKIRKNLKKISKILIMENYINKSNGYSL